MTGPDAVMFDLDGTLADSLPGIEYSIDEALRECGCAPRQGSVRPLIGPPIRTILGRIATGAGPETLNALEAAFRRSYDTEGWRRTVWFDGAIEAIEELHAAGIRLFVVTNKPEQCAREIVAGVRSLLSALVCRNGAPDWTSKPAMVRHVVDAYAIRSANAWFVGDSREDYQAARENGISCILVKHGYGYSDELANAPGTKSIGAFSELIRFFEQEKAV